MSLWEMLTGPKLGYIKVSKKTTKECNRIAPVDMATLQLALVGDEGAIRALLEVGVRAEELNAQAPAIKKAIAAILKAKATQLEMLEEYQKGVLELADQETALIGELHEKSMTQAFRRDVIGPHQLAAQKVKLMKGLESAQSRSETPKLLAKAQRVAARIHLSGI